MNPFTSSEPMKCGRCGEQVTRIQAAINWKKRCRTITGTCDNGHETNYEEPLGAMAPGAPIRQMIPPGQ